MIAEAVGKIAERAKRIAGEIADARELGSLTKSAPVPDIHVEVNAANGGEVKAMVCPQCGANVQAAIENGASFCGYCGTQLHLDDGSTTVVYRTVDETRIRELEAEQLLKLKQLEIEERRRPGRLRLMAALAIIGVLMMVIGQFAGHASGDGNDPWYTVSLLGMFPLMAVAFLWISDLPDKK